MADFDKVLDFKPDFTAARISRGNIHLKQADYDLAQLDFYNVVGALILYLVKVSYTFFFLFFTCHIYKIQISCLLIEIFAEHYMKHPVYK